MTVRLQHTKKYDLFDLWNFNRDVQKTKRLEASMKKHGFLPAYPLHCIRNGSGKLLVKAGHHRLEVAKGLLEEVYYVILDDDATIHELEKATNRWTPADYLKSHARDGKESYVAVGDYHERTSIPLQHCIALVAGETAGSNNQTERFKAGTYKANHDDPHPHREVLAEILDHCEECGVKFAKKSLFVQAVSRCLRAPEFNAKTFCTRVAAHPGLLTKQPTLDTTMSMIEMVYNHGSHSASRLAVKFLVDAEMAKRSATYHGH